MGDVLFHPCGQVSPGIASDFGNVIFKSADSCSAMSSQRFQIFLNFGNILSNFVFQFSIIHLMTLFSGFRLDLVLTQKWIYTQQQRSR
jgi:hypothetical protein